MLSPMEISHVTINQWCQKSMVQQHCDRRKRTERRRSNFLNKIQQKWVCNQKAKPNLDMHRNENQGKQHWNSKCQWEVEKSSYADKIFALFIGHSPVNTYFHKWWLAVVWGKQRLLLWDSTDALIDVMAIRIPFFFFFFFFFLSSLLCRI